MWSDGPNEERNRRGLPWEHERKRAERFRRWKRAGGLLLCLFAAAIVATLIWPH